MSKIWIFGDSYGVHLADSQEKNTSWFWAYSLGKRLGCTEYKNFSQMGVGNDYIHYSLDLHSHEISSKDFVIVISSSINREWLVEDQPYVSNYYVNNLHEFLTRDKYNSIIMYLKNLQFQTKINLNFKKMLSTIHYMTDKFDWNLVIIPGFENDGFPVSHKYDVKGSLFDVCYNEFETIEDREWFYNDFCSHRDKRAGHIIKNNHKVLEDKLFNVFTKGDTLDLTVGFEEKIISKQNVNFLKDQMSEYDITSEKIVNAFVPSY